MFEIQDEAGRRRRIGWFACMGKPRKRHTAKRRERARTAREGQDSKDAWQHRASLLVMGARPPIPLSSNQIKIGVSTQTLNGLLFDALWAPCVSRSLCSATFCGGNRSFLASFQLSRTFWQLITSSWSLCKAKRSSERSYDAWGGRGAGFDT